MPGVPWGGVQRRITTLEQQFAKSRRRAPQIGISCTIGDLSVMTALEMVEAVLARDVRIFRFGDLAEYERIDGVTWMQHISTMAPADLDEARLRFRRAIARIDTPEELVAFRHGGILPYVLRQLVGK